MQHALLSVRAAQGASLAAVARGVEGVLRQFGVSHATVQVFTREPPPAAPAPGGAPPAALVLAAEPKVDELGVRVEAPPQESS